MNTKEVSFIKNGVVDIELALPIISKFIDNEIGSEYSTLRDLVIMHNRTVARSRFGLEEAAVLYIKDYNLKITYSKQNGSELKVEYVNPTYINDAWFCVNINEPIELKFKKVELQFNGSDLELVASRQCKTILPTLETVETMVEFASFQFDLVNKKTNHYGERMGWKGLKNAGLGEFEKFLFENGCRYTQGNLECLMIVKEAINSSPELARVAEEINLLRVAQSGMFNLITMMYQYITNDSIKLLLNSSTGFYLLERFNAELKHQYSKPEEQFKNVFHSGTNLFEILGIEEQDRTLFAKLVDKEERFYAEWNSYTNRNEGQKRQSYFGFTEMI